MMRHFTPVWAVLALLAEVAAAQPPQQPPADRGRLEAGLPPGAAVRLGGPRWPDEAHYRRVAFSPDGTLLACTGVKPPDPGKAGADHAVQIRDGHRGKLLAELVGHEDAPRAIAFSADSKTLVSAGRDKTVRLWNLADGRLLWTAPGCDATQVGFSADGKQIIAARSAREIVVLDRAGGSKQKEIAERKPRSDKSFTLLPDGKGLVEASGELRLVFRDALSGSPAASSGLAQPLVVAVRRMAAGKQSVEQCLWPSLEQTGSELNPGLLSLVDPASGEVLKTLADCSKPPYRDYESIAFSADGKRIALCRWLPQGEVEVVVRPLDPGKEVARFVLFGGFNIEVGTNPIRFAQVLHRPSAAFSPDGARIAMISQYGLRLGEVATGNLLGPEDETGARPVDAEHQSYVHAMVFSPDGSLVATAAADGFIGLWSAKTGKGVGRWPHLLIPTTEWPVAFSPDGSRMAFASGEDIVVVQTADGKKLIRLQPGASLPSSQRLFAFSAQTAGVAMAFSPDGKRFVAWFLFERTLIEWETGSWTEQRSVRLVPPQKEMPILRSGPSQDGYSSVTFSPTLRRMTMGRPEGSVLFTFNTQSGQSLFKASAAEPFTSARFSPDESLLALGVPDGTIQIVDVRQGQTLQTLRGPAGMTFVRAFLEDGRVLASYHDDRATRFWDVRTGREIGRWRGHCLWACSPDERLAATVSTESAASDLGPLAAPNQVRIPTPVFLWDLRALAGRLRKGPP